MSMYLKVKKRVFKIIDIPEKNDKASKYFDILILILIVSNTLAIVLESFDSFHMNFSRELRVFEIFSVSIFSLEYLLRLWTAEFRYAHGKGKIKAVIKYMFSGMAIIDLLAILPFYLPMIIPVDLRFLRMFRISRLLRILKLNRYTKALRLIMSVVSEKKEELLATVFVMGFMIMISSTMMYFFESEVQPESFPNIVASFWWSIATLTTVGYGDVYPITGMGKLFASLIAILGIGLVALPTGIISSGFVALISNKEKEKPLVICPHCGGKSKLEDLQND